MFLESRCGTLSVLTPFLAKCRASYDIRRNDAVISGESESEKEHKREPGDPGTSLPVMDSNLVSPFHNDPSDGDAPTSGLHPDLRHQTTDEHDDEEEDEQIHFVNVYRAKIN